MELDELKKMANFDTVKCHSHIGPTALGLCLGDGELLDCLVSYWTGYAECLFGQAQLTKSKLKEFREWLDGKRWH